MYGLYDSDGILRFMGVSREACEDYAALFELSLASCSLLSIPRAIGSPLRSRRARRPTGSSS
ncbi:hypothetical protein CWE17_03095 [Synechococcus sp. BS56D]|jgi:hypothetical protein|nr:hypothetical protein [Synechococcaceae bacterium WB9_4xB_025]TCD58887.1 hypothetical protein CWE17_03095 [Synechococcus sp. BS56D]